ncbi:Transcription factor, partial [Thalictrum thalictroides]
RMELCQDVEVSEAAEEMELENDGVLMSVHSSVMFSPPWFSTYERTFLWIAGFKPGIPFRILNRTVADLSGEQLRRIDILKAETRTREKELSNELAKVQEGVATSYLMEITGGFVTSETVRRQIENQDGRPQMNDAVREMRDTMEALVHSADSNDYCQGDCEDIKSIDFLGGCSSASSSHSGNGS